jgi:hypothetical protein
VVAGLDVLQAERTSCPSARGPQDHIITRDSIPPAAAPTPAGAWGNVARSGSRSGRVAARSGPAAAASPGAAAHLNHGLGCPEGLLLAHSEAEPLALELQLHDVGVVHHPAISAGASGASCAPSERSPADRGSGSAIEGDGGVGEAGAAALAPREGGQGGEGAPGTARGRATATGALVPQSPARALHRPGSAPQAAPDDLRELVEVQHVRRASCAGLGRPIGALLSGSPDDALQAAIGALGARPGTMRRPAGRFLC